MNKRIALIALGILTVLGAIAFAAGENIIDKMQQYRPGWSIKGLYIGPASINPPSNTNNKITYTLSGVEAFQFTDAGAGSCQTSTGVTVTGAAVGDPCMVSGGAMRASATYSCFVSSANTVKVKECVEADEGGTQDAGYFTRIFSNQ